MRPAAGPSASAEWTLKETQDRSYGRPAHQPGPEDGARPTSKKGDVGGAGGEQAAQEPEELLHEALHVLCPLGLVPGRQHRLQQVYGKDLCGAMQNAGVRESL